MKPSVWQDQGATYVHSCCSVDETVEVNNSQEHNTKRE